MGELAKVFMPCGVVVLPKPAFYIAGMTDVEPSVRVLEYVDVETGQWRTGAGVDGAEFHQPGCPGRDRTYDKVVNSHLLYR